MQTLEEQLDDFAPLEVAQAVPEKPRRKRVGAFSTNQPLPEPIPPFAPKVPHVLAAISAVTAGLAQSGIGKTRRNTQQGYAFRGIDDVYNALASLLVAHKLVILPQVEDRTVTERAARGGGVLFFVTVKMSFDLVSAVDGSRERVTSFGEAMDSGDKATNKALSTAYKYMAMQVFCIPTIGHDPEEDTYEVAAPQPAPAELGSRHKPVPATPPEPVSLDPDYDALLNTAKLEAINGWDHLRVFWEHTITKEERQTLEPDLGRLKELARKADDARKELARPKGKA